MNSADFFAKPKPPEGSLWNMTFTFSKPDLSSGLYELGYVAVFYSNQTPAVGFAVCEGKCSLIWPYRANLVSKGGLGYNSYNWTASYREWRLNNTVQGAFFVFSPYSFPLDAYETPMFYFAFNRTFGLFYIGLKSSILSSFVASFANIGLVSSQDLPSDLKKNPQFVNGSVMAVRIIMVRSLPNLIVSSLYTVAPVFSIYEVAVLSFSSLKQRKERLLVYIGALFSVFAYFLTLRQMMPPYPTYLEGAMSLGMAVWIIREATC